MSIMTTDILPAGVPSPPTISKRGPTRIVILGGGFGGVYTAAHLERIWQADPNVQVTLVSRTNYFLMTPLLFEAGSGVLEPRHAVNPIRQLFTHARFVQAEIEGIDIANRAVMARQADDEPQRIEYDHLVLALGGVTNTKLIPGSAEHALRFKTLADAIHLRNHTIQRFERADVETDPKQRDAQLAFVVIGAGLVGVELIGEMTDFVRHVARIYKRVDPSRIRFELVEAMPRIIPEFDEPSASYAAKVLAKRGVRIQTSTKVRLIEPGRVHLETGETIDSETIVIATGVVPNPLLADLPLPKDKRGRVEVDGTMRVKGHSKIWALGDCALIPDPSSKPYPPLAQHAIREGAALAENITSAIHDRPLVPFVYETQGSLAALGHFRGVGKVWGVPVRGFIAWWIWRSYYLFRMPRWNRRLRIMVDWAIALLFKNDVAQLDLDRLDVDTRRS
jgi:NADH:ubiquinone reductase (H+-translocating)